MPLHARVMVRARKSFSSHGIFQQLSQQWQRNPRKERRGAQWRWHLRRAGLARSRQANSKHGRGPLFRPQCASDVEYGVSLRRNFPKGKGQRPVSGRVKSRPHRRVQSRYWLLQRDFLQFDGIHELPRRANAGVSTFGTISMSPGLKVVVLESNGCTPICSM